MADIKQIEVSGTKYNISGAAIVLEDNGTTTDGVFLAKTNQITSLVEGQTFLYRATKGLKFDRSATLNITANGTALGAKKLFVYNNSNWISESLTCATGPNTYLLLMYTQYSDGNNYNGFLVLNAPSQSLYNITKIYHGDHRFEVTSYGLQWYHDSGAYFTLHDGYSTYRTSDGNTPHLKYINQYGEPGFDLVDDNENTNIQFKSTKILGYDHLTLGTKIYQHSRIEIHDYKTKIYLPHYDDDDNNCSAQYEFKISRMEANRPLHLTSPDDEHDSFGTTLKYNKTEDCFEVIFE